MANLSRRYLAPERESIFPLLTKRLYEVTSDETADYNCIAFAAGDETRWWWPDPDGQYYWPSECRREQTVEAFIQMFECIGYKKCKCSLSKRGLEKVAIYADPVGSPDVPAGSPTHAARQIATGAW